MSVPCKPDLVASIASLLRGISFCIACRMGICLSIGPHIWQQHWTIVFLHSFIHNCHYAGAAILCFVDFAGKSILVLLQSISVCFITNDLIECARSVAASYTRLCSCIGRAGPRARLMQQTPCSIHSARTCQQLLVVVVSYRMELPTSHRSLTHQLQSLIHSTAHTVSFRLVPVENTFG